VLVGVGFGPDPEEPSVEKPCRAGQHPLGRKALQRKVPGALGPEMRQGTGELEGVVELLLIAPLAPPLVIQVLPPAGGVGADGLEVPVLVGADPDIDPSGW